MATILCAKSGIQFKCDHFPIAFTANELHHPVFDAPLKRLWKYFPKWQAGELNEVDSYLYFLALLNSTELIEWRTAASPSSDTFRICNSYLESLFSTIGKIVAIRSPRFVLPRFAITSDTRTLRNVSNWIAVWNDCYNDFASGLKQQELRSKIQSREVALERLIKNPAIRPEKYAAMLAHWASIAGQFPSFTLSINGAKISCSEYWQSIIVRCHNEIELIQLNRKDLVELIEHCEQEIDLGTIFSYHLFNTLRSALDTIDGFFNVGNNTTFSILGTNDSIESSNLQLLIDDAPASAPKRIDYPSEFQFLKAKMKWNLACSQNGESQNG